MLKSGRRVAANCQNGSKPIKIPSFFWAILSRADGVRFKRNVPGIKAVNREIGRDTSSSSSTKKMFLGRKD